MRDWSSSPELCIVPARNHSPVLEAAPMATKLDKTIKREIEMDGTAYMVTISPEGVKLTQKGFRKGREITWKNLWNSGTEEGAQ
jgi:hypothetical protein